MDHIDMDLIVDHEYANELFNRWLTGGSDLDWIPWLKRMVMHYAVGGASNENVDILKKTIMTLINEIENEK